MSRERARLYNFISLFFILMSVVVIVLVAVMLLRPM